MQQSSPTAYRRNPDCGTFLRILHICALVVGQPLCPRDDYMRMKGEDTRLRTLSRRVRLGLASTFTGPLIGGAVGPLSPWGWVPYRTGPIGSHRVQEPRIHNLILKWLAHCWESFVVDWTARPREFALAGFCLSGCFS